MNPGLSGGPLMNSKGQVVGVVAAMVEKAEGVGFAVPINDAATVLAKAGISVSVVPSSKALAYQTSKTHPAAVPILPTARQRVVWPLALALIVLALIAVGLTLLVRYRQMARRRGHDLGIAFAPPARRRPLLLRSREEDLEDVDIELK